MKKYSKQIISVLLIVIFIMYILVLSPKAMQNDTFWSIKVGEKIVKEGIIRIDDFSIHQGLYYVAHHFLTDILIYIVYSFSGFEGLYILEVLLAMLLASVLYLLNKEVSKSKIVSVTLLFIQMFIMQGFIAVRAQMISFILFALELLLLEKYKNNKKKTYIIGLCTIPILLANFHMGVIPFYFIILGVYIISFINLRIPFLQCNKECDKIAVKHLVLIVIIGIFTIFINPYFIDGVTYSFKTIGNEFINTTIAEFKNLSISFDGGWSLLYIGIIILILIINDTKVRLGDFLLLFGTLFMAFISIRYVSLFVICSFVCLRYVNKLINMIAVTELDYMAIKASLIFTMTLIVVVLFAGYMIKSKEEYIPPEKYPVAAVEYIKNSMNEQDRIFNFYDWGSYLMLNNIKVYIDSRCDLYTKEYNGTDIADDFNKLLDCDKDYKQIIEKYNINMFLIPAKTALSTLLEENIDYKMMYKDDIAAVYKHI